MIKIGDVEIKTCQKCGSGSVALTKKAGQTAFYAECMSCGHTQEVPTSIRDAFDAGNDLKVKF